MAITPTMGSTVARATLPLWLRPESPLLVVGEDCVLVEDCVWGTTTGGGVAAAAGQGTKVNTGYQAFGGDPRCCRQELGKTQLLG